VPSASCRRWARRERPARPLRSFAPPGSPFRNDLAPGQAEIVRRCSPGVLHPPELPPPRFGVRSLARPHVWGKAPATHILGRPAIAVADRDPDSDAWAREPRIRRYAASIELRVSPSGDGPAHSTPLERSNAPAASPVPAPCRAFQTERLARAPSSAAPRAFLPLAAVSPVRGRRPLDLEDARVEPLTRPHPSRGRLATGPLAELGLVVP